VPKPDYTALDLPEPPPDRPYVLVNMIMSADGKAVVDGTEQGLGSKVDQRLMREIRVNADMIVNGAETLRTSGASPRLGGHTDLEALRATRGKPRFPTASVLSRSGDLPLDRAFFTADDFDAVVFLSDSAPAERRAAIGATGRPVIDLPAGNEVPAMLRQMRDLMGVRVLLCEGGPTLNAELFSLDAVDEYFLTVGPAIVAGRDTPTTVGGNHRFTRETLKRLRLVSAIANDETDEVYLRYRIRR
jgi:2,5-diamino-6-(ribosylamino)-4(3H)-pyrimidinone 5'-phosphate reductase